jgi:predicted AAA+ superfamily ATPase
MAAETTPYIPRLLDLDALTRTRSHFLFGPRRTGKSTLIRRSLPNARVYNLLDDRVFSELARRPSLLREELTGRDPVVVIDEIQRLPALLNEVHLLIEERRTRFLLTGSSGRKLRRGGTNLLGGRARVMALHPLLYRELGPKFDLLQALNRGLIPSVYLSDDPDADLAAYAGAYLREEIAAEGLLRNVPAFGRFLEVAASSNATLVNYARIASDAQVARSTVQEYVQILLDTLIAYLLPAWRESVRRKPISTSKLYFFDVGVVRHLRREGAVRRRSPGFGHAFETYFFHELRAYVDYRRGGSLAFWRSKSGFEVDFVLDDETAIEVKGTDTIDNRDLAGLRALREEKKLRNYRLVCLVDRPREIDGIRVLPWRVFLDELWGTGLRKQG